MLFWSSEKELKDPLFKVSVQKDATFLGATYCVQLHTLLRVVGSCWAKLETGQTFEAATPKPFFIVTAGGAWQ